MNKIFLLFFLIWSPFLTASVFFNGPYLQNVTEKSATISWELGSEIDSSVVFGRSEKRYYRSVKAEVKKLKGIGVPRKNRLYTVRLNNLAPGSTYYYKIKLGSKVSENYSFKTFSKNIENFSFLAMSDAQEGFKKTKKVVDENIMINAFRDYRSKDLYPVKFVLFSGDLVQHGERHSEWEEQFFSPLKSLFERIPVFPAIGNHDNEHPLYYDYFDLPKNSSEGYKEKWYYFDHANVRFIALNTNSRFRNDIQLKWFERKIIEVEKNSHLDFVVAFFHHPYQSETNTGDNTEYVGRIQEILENFSNRSNKPSVYLYGHTHSYSRGHSFKSNLSMVCVAPLGGRFERWRDGGYKNEDYPEYLVSQLERGWVMAQVTTGKEPKIIFKRYSHRGGDRGMRDLGVVDQFTIKRFNKVPKRPLITNIKKLDKKNYRMKSSAFKDPDNDGHLTTQIQLSNQINFETIEKEIFFNYKNIYREEDKNRGIDLTNLEIAFKLKKEKKYLRIRYRDKSLGWSMWSHPKIIKK